MVVSTIMIRYATCEVLYAQSSSVDEVLTFYHTGSSKLLRSIVPFTICIDEKSPIRVVVPDDDLQCKLSQGCLDYREICLKSADIAQ